MINLLGFFLPPADSTIAAEVDRLFLFILWISAFFLALITFGTIYLVIRYRRKSKAELTPGISHNTALEIIWSVIPGILVMVMFFWGFHLYMKMYMPPSNSLEVRVTAKKWSWMFTYPEGVKSDKLVVPQGRPVKLVMSSEDVIHSLFIPNFRVKMDVLPYRYTTLWFEATNQGNYDLFCTEYCGDAHSQMNTLVVVKSTQDYKAWIEENQRPPTGQEVYTLYGCNACHSIDGAPGIGPSFKGIYESQHQLTDGSTITVDDNYLRESILEPQAKVVAGYQPVMPRQPDMTNEEMNAVIDFIKSLKE